MTIQLRCSNNSNYIDTLKGITSILLVAYHVIGISPHSGLCQHDGILREASDLLAYIRIPIFSFLSGLVYARRPCRAEWKRFIKGKIRRLIAPMLAVGTIFAVFQSIIPGTNNSISQWKFLHLLPVAHYWFVESLFLAFLIIIPMEHKRILESKVGIVSVFLCAVLLSVSHAGTPWLSIAGVIYIFPYFLAGIFCSRFSLQFRNEKATGYLLLGVVIFLLIQGHNHIVDRLSPTAILIGITYCLSMLFIRPESGILSRIGFFSYSIYLFHVFFTAASRIIFSHLGVTNIWILFLLGTFFGITGSIMVDIAASRKNISRLLLLGKKPIFPKNITTCISTSQL